MRSTGKVRYLTLGLRIDLGRWTHTQLSKVPCVSVRRVRLSMTYEATYDALGGAFPEQEIQGS
jgi:hypothetical protein